MGHEWISIYIVGSIGIYIPSIVTYIQVNLFWLRFLLSPHDCLPLAWHVIYFLYSIRTYAVFLFLLFFFSSKCVCSRFLYVAHQFHGQTHCQMETLNRLKVGEPVQRAVTDWLSRSEEKHEKEWFLLVKHESIELLGSWVIIMKRCQKMYMYI